MPTAFCNAMLQQIATNQNQVFIMRPVGELTGLPMNTSDFMCLRQDEQEVFDKLNLAKKTCVLDYGCGIGRHLVYLRKHFPNVDLHICGLDICEGLLNYCRETLPENSDFESGLEGFQHQTYDLILFMGNGLGVLGDESNAIEMLTDLTNRLNPGGRILIETGNPFGNGYYSSLYTISFQGQEDPQFSWGYSDKRWLTDFFGNLGCNVTFSPSNAPGGCFFFAEVRRFNDDQNQPVKTSTSSEPNPNLKSGITPMESSSPTNIKDVGAADSELNHPIATNNDKTTPMSNFDLLKNDDTFFYFATESGTTKENTLDLAKNNGLIIRAAYKTPPQEIPPQDYNKKPPAVSTGLRQLSVGSKIILCYGGGRGGLYRPLVELIVIEDHPLLDEINDLTGSGFGVLKNPDLIQKVTNFGYEKDPFLRKFTAIGVTFNRYLNSNVDIKNPNPHNAIITFDQVQERYPNLLLTTDKRG